MALHLVDALEGGSGDEGVGDKQRGLVVQLQHLLRTPLAERVLPNRGRAPARVQRPCQQLARRRSAPIHQHHLPQNALMSGYDSEMRCPASHHPSVGWNVKGFDRHQQSQFAGVLWSLSTPISLVNMPCSQGRIERQVMRSLRRALAAVRYLWSTSSKGHTCNRCP